MDTLLFDAKDIAICNEWVGVDTQNPLVGLIDLSKVKPLHHIKMLYGFYVVYLIDVKCGELRYGKNYYNYEKGSLMFIAPGQVFGKDDDGVAFQPAGFLLMFHPDLIRNSSLKNVMQNYNFFSYGMNEALHISLEERRIVLDCFHRIGYELNHPTDEHSWDLLIDGIKTLLDYCDRFYTNRFPTGVNQAGDILVKFEKLLDDYFKFENAKMNGLPTVQFCADAFHMSPTCLSDKLKKETGKTTRFFIREKVMDLAKTALVSSNQTVSEIAYSLGFQYSQHFARWFKNHVGCTPNEYRSHDS